MNKVLNLAHPEKSEIQYTLTTFPDGEPHIVLNDFNAKWDVTIKCRIRNPNELFILCEVLDILNRNGVYPLVNIYYLMSMRMDRVMDITRPFSLKIVTDILNTFKINGYGVFGMHSNKTSKLLRYSYERGKVETIDEIMTSSRKGALIVYPDASANQHFMALNTCKSISVNKTRDVNTGLIKMSLNESDANELRNYNEVWIVDDLIDGGATIDLLCNEIEKVSDSIKINVFAYHCVNEKGISKLLTNHSNLHLYTTNSYNDWDYKSKHFHIENIID